jgi:two-component system phosphate regulon sensor histidine kinase PhoR
MLIAASVPDGFRQRMWEVLATPIGSRAVAADQLAQWLVVFGTLATLSITLGAILAVRSARSGAELAALRADFVSAVTHELKTPIATIRAVAETIAAGRVGTAVQGDYARLVIQEALRLTRFVDNLLAFSRITDVSAVYQFEQIPIGSLIQESLDGFRLHLSEAGFEVLVVVPEDLPQVQGDRSALGLVLANLLDNAIRHSCGKYLSISAQTVGHNVIVEIEDHGRGIAPDEIDNVTRKFYRGRNAGPGGSGLGLAIARRIVLEHGGALTLRSVVDVGTTVSVILRIACTENGANHSSN